MDKNNKDNKIKANDELKIDFTKGSDDTTPLAVKKTSTEIENDAIKFVSTDGVQNNSTNINSNLGKFTTDFDVQANMINDDVIVSDKSKQLGSIREQDKKVDFSKFSKTKKNKNLASTKSKFAIKVDTLLRNDRTLLIVWSAAILTIITCLAFTISFAVTLTLDWKNKPDASFFNFQWVQNTALAANSFSYISMGLIALPLLYLLITVLVGINGVYRSRSFHYFLWICLITAFVLMLVSLIMSSMIISYENSFIRPKAN